MENQEFNSENGNNSQESCNFQEPMERVRKNFNEVKDAVTEQANGLKGQAIGLKERLSEQTRSYGGQLADKIDNARGKTSATLHTTSDQIKSLAMYVEEHDTRDMSEAVIRTSSNLIRKHPGKSIIAGLIIGLLLGRVAGSARASR
jgi:ElaB/YqjD/DUF883 family membrane-anchored ribosome-binding protein